MDEYQQSRVGSLPDDADAEADREWAEYVAWLDRETAAGRDPAPEIQSPEPWESGDCDDPDPVFSRFGQGDEADGVPPGPLLAALTELAAADADRLSDDELVGVLQASRRLVAREQYKQVLLTAEFARRRQAAFAAAAARGVPVGCRPGGFPGDELAAELVITPAEAGHRIDDALDLTARLPHTLAGMAAGKIDETRAGWIALYTRSLSPADTARADEILAGAAPELREEQLARKALGLEKKLNPEAVAARKEHARRNEQRVEARRELSGNASLSGREMDTADVIASKAYLDALAARLRGGGLPGSLGALRVRALADLTQGRDPLDRLRPPGPATSPDPAPVPAVLPDPATPHPDPDAWPGWDTGDDGDEAGSWDDQPGDPGPDGDGPGHGCAHQAAPVPVPALITLLVPAGTLLGWSTAPAQAGTWGLLDRDETRAVAGAAALHPRTRWCVTLLAPDGTALAHACARGRHPGLLNDLEPQPPPAQLAEIIRRLNLTFTPVHAGCCDHAQAEDHYSPSRKLRHLVRARTATCDAPGCQAQAVNADLDHTIPWPAGPTEQCNLAPRCRTHHRAKQAPDWQAEQVQPGVTRWTLPSGRTHVTTPTKYDT